MRCLWPEGSELPWGLVGDRLSQFPWATVRGGERRPVPAQPRCPGSQCQPLTPGASGRLLLCPLHLSVLPRGQAAREGEEQGVGDLGHTPGQGIQVLRDLRQE